MAQIITLTTDFGLADHYVGTMKGVLLARCPGASIVDISHEIESFSILSGAYAVDQAAPYFPAGTVHLIVVDPGVGTARRMVLVEALKQFFIAPDNGVLTLILTRDPNARCYELTNRKLWLESPSSTFHGRDLFAPTAAAIASGAATPLDAGVPIERIETLPGLDVREIGRGEWQGTVLSIDHFGNVITNFRSRQFAQIDRQPFRITIQGRDIDKFFSTFGAARAGVCFAYFGSSGYIEIGMNQQNAASYLAVLRGAEVKISLPHGQANEKNEPARYNLSNS